MNSPNSLADVPMPCERICSEAKGTGLLVSDSIIFPRSVIRLWADIEPVVIRMKMIVATLTEKSFVRKCMRRGLRYDHRSARNKPKSVESPEPPRYFDDSEDAINEKAFY